MKDYTGYWNTNLNDRIVYYGKKLLDVSMKGFEAKDVLVDGVSKRILVQEKYSANGQGKKRTIIGEVDSFKYGSIIEYENYSWLSNAFILNENGVYDKGVMELCDDVLKLETEPEQIQVGTDPMGRPIYKNSEGTVTEIPCITTTTISNSTEDSILNLPEGTIQITIPNTEHEALVIGTEINIHNVTYRISGFDYSGVINSNGIIKIKAERTQEV